MEYYEEIGSLKVLPDDKLKSLNTKRLLAYKKSVLAQKSAIFHRNKEAIKMEHPFDVAEHISYDPEEGDYISRTLKEVVNDYRGYIRLERLHKKIKDILSTRENVE